MSNEDAVALWFQQATGNEPYPFQIRFAYGDWLRNAVPVPGHHDVPFWLLDGERRGKDGLGKLVPSE